MIAAHRRYFALEMGISAVINAALSVAFVFLVFGGRAQVPVLGWGGIAADAFPQSFMVALMSCLVPTLLTRRRVRAGVVAPLPMGLALPRAIAVRAVLIAGLVALVAIALQMAVLPLFGTLWRFETVLMLKAVYGAVLGAAVAAFSVRAALGDR